MAKIGDTVRFLNSVGGGRIVRIDGNIAHVEDNDGFDIPVLLRECVVVGTEPAHKAPSKEVIVEKHKQAPVEAPLPVTETATGNKLNIVLTFEPRDIKKLSSTEFDLTLVNDSNYYVDFMLATRGDDDEEWTLLQHATLEPNLMLTVGECTSADLNSFENILFQYFAFKDSKAFAMKRPGSVDMKVDTTKLCKLHCFRENVYFDEPVVAFNLVTDDVPYSPTKIDTKELQSEMRRKKNIDSRPAVRPVKKHYSKNNDIIEVDLHINELVDSTAGLSRADMLNLQIDEFRRVMDANLKHHGQKIVFIHGKGEGVLRQALLKELAHRYKGHDICDASFREYGFGATQVTIH